MGFLNLPFFGKAEQPKALEPSTSNAITPEVLVPQPATPPTLDQCSGIGTNRHGWSCLKCQNIDFGNTYLYGRIHDCSVFCLWGFATIVELERDDRDKLAIDFPMLQAIEAPFLENRWTKEGRLPQTLREGTSLPPVFKKGCVSDFLKQFEGMFIVRGDLKLQDFKGYQALSEKKPISSFRMPNNNNANEHSRTPVAVSVALAEGATEMVARWLTYQPERFTPSAAQQDNKTLFEAENDLDNTVRTLLMAAEIKRHWDTLEKGEQDPFKRLQLDSAVSIFLYGAHYALENNWENDFRPTNSTLEEIWGKIQEKAPDILRYKMNVYGTFLENDETRRGQMQDYIENIIFTIRLGGQPETPALPTAANNNVRLIGQGVSGSTPQRLIESAQQVTAACLEVMARSAELTPAQQQAAQVVMNNCAQQLQAILNNESFAGHKSILSASHLTQEQADDFYERNQEKSQAVRQAITDVFEEKAGIPTYWELMVGINFLPDEVLSQGVERMQPLSSFEQPSARGAEPTSTENNYAMWALCKVAELVTQNEDGSQSAQNPLTAQALLLKGANPFAPRPTGGEQDDDVDPPYERAVKAGNTEIVAIFEQYRNSLEAGISISA